MSKKKGREKKQDKPVGYRQTSESDFRLSLKPNEMVIDVLDLAQ